MKLAKMGVFWSLSVKLVLKNPVGQNLGEKMADVICLCCVRREWHMA